jgi:hypothetical protein
LIGPTGPQGLPGETGAQGVPGAQGLTGATGPQGLLGPTGPQGLTGAAGPQGLIGPTGPQGLTGPTGPQGLTGSAGPQGAPGAPGTPGATGLQGPAGDPGFTGPQGVQGVPGPGGPAGAVDSTTVTTLPAAVPPPLNQFKPRPITTTESSFSMTLLHQDFYGSDGFTDCCNPDLVTYYKHSRVPGMVQTVLVPDNSMVTIATDGGVQHGGRPSDTQALYTDVAIFVDGQRLPNGGVSRLVVTQPRDDNHYAAEVANWHMTASLALAPGQHTVEVCARRLDPEEVPVIIGGENDNADSRWGQNGAPYVQLVPNLSVTVTKPPQ